ncbi:MAG TPA: DNA-binding protein [Treponema sp.]|nr:DNA-binding protein [Treponema sp.]
MKKASNTWSQYPDLLRTKDVQNILRVGRSTVYSMLKNGEIKSLKIRTAYRIPKDLLIDYINSKAQKSR